MAEIQSGDMQDVIKQVTEQLTNGATDIGRVLQEVMSNVFKRLGITAVKDMEEQYKVAMKKILENTKGTGAKLEDEFEEWGEIFKREEKIMSEVSSTEERRRSNEFNKNIKEQISNLDKALTLKKAMYKLAGDEELAAVKKTEDAKAALLKLTAKEKKSLEGQAAASEGLMGKLGSVGEITGLTGAMKSTFSMLAVANVAMLGIQQTLAYPQAAAGLRGAQANIGGSALPGIFNNMPGGLTSPMERMQMMQSVFTSAPRLITETAESTRKFVGYLGYFGYSMKDSTDVLIAANRNLNMSSEDVIETYQLASGINKKYGLSVGESADLTLKMVGSLRMMGMGSKEAIAIMQAIPDIGKMGKVSSTEFKGYAEAMSGFIGSMSPSSLGGIMMYLKGGGLPTSDQLMGGAKGSPQMMGELYQSIKGNFGAEGNNMKLYIAEGFAKGMGLTGFQSVKATEVLSDMLENMKSMDIKSIYEELSKAGVAPTEKIMGDGLNNLVDMNGTLKNIENILKDTLAPLGMVMTGITKGLGSLGLNGPGGRILGAAATGAGIGGAVGGLPGAGVGVAIGVVSSIGQELLSGR